MSSTQEDVGSNHQQGMDDTVDSKMVNSEHTYGAKPSRQSRWPSPSFFAFDLDPERDFLVAFTLLFAPSFDLVTQQQQRQQQKQQQ